MGESGTTGDDREMFDKARRSALAAAATAALFFAAAGAHASAIGTPEAAGRLAYIDPGSGSFILQALVAALAGIAVAINAYWTRIKRFLGIGAPEQEEDVAVPKPRDD